MTGIKSEVVVIGAGVAGISAAFELSKTHKVIILEKNYLFSGSSGRNPGRMGHGFHYIDYETAKLYLEASIQVQRIYPHFLIGEHLPFEHPVRHGRYYVTKTSLYSFEEVLQSYRKLQQRYAELVAEDPENKVFGEPESFFRVLDVSEYRDHINAEIIEGGVETCEHLFNWQAFSLHIRQMILANSRISLMENCEVVDLAHYQELDSRFKLKVKTRHGDNLDINTQFIVNSAWENVEHLNDKLGITYINGQRTNRLKCLVEVKLPPSLLSVNSSFFCMGSFCMFSNMGDGRAMMTLADVTNMEVSSARMISANMARFVNGEVTQAEKDRIGLEIKNGVACYIPAMEFAEVLDVKFGIVQTKGEMTLQDLQHREGAHHVRNYHHIREEMQGLISNPAMKLFYFVQNGIEVRKIFDTQEARDFVIRATLRAMQHECERLYYRDDYCREEINRAWAIHLDKMMFYSLGCPDLFDKLIVLMVLKRDLNQELLRGIFNFLRPRKSSTQVPEMVVIEQPIIHELKSCMTENVQDMFPQEKPIIQELNSSNAINIQDDDFISKQTVASPMQHNQSNIIQPLIRQDLSHAEQMPSLFGLNALRFFSAYCVQVLSGPLLIRQRARQVSPSGSSQYEPAPHGAELPEPIAMVLLR